MASFTLDERGKAALQAAEEAFYASLASSYPEAASGDLCPGLAMQFEQVAQNVVIHWVASNVRTAA